MFAEQLLGARRSVLTWYLSHGVFTNITLLTIFLVPVGDGWHPWEPEGYRENRLLWQEVAPVGQNFITSLSIFSWRKAGFQIGLDPHELLRVLTMRLIGDSSPRCAEESHPSGVSQTLPSPFCWAVWLGKQHVRWEPPTSDDIPITTWAPGWQNPEVQSALITALLGST